MMARLAAFLAFIVAICAPALLHAQDAATVGAVVERTFVPLMKKHEVPGLAVGVTAGGRQHLFYYGVASKETGEAVNADTLFEIGSISKMFTATLAAYAQTQGKLSFDDPIGQYMTALRDTALDKATLINLATYTPGLPLHLPNAIKTLAEAESFIATLKIKAAPGEMRSYSNPSAGLLGHITALAMNGNMNGNFASLMETQLLPKLGIKGCFIRVPEARAQDYAQGYKGNMPRRMGQAVFGDEAYGLKCTAPALLRFVEDNIRPDRLEPSVQRAVAATQVGYFRVGGMVQGFGWEQYPWPVTLKRLLAGNSNDMIFKPNAATRLDPPRAPSGPTLFNKTGSTAAFSAYAAFVPAKQLGIVILSNKSIPTPARVTAAHAVLDALAPQ
jgi:beta-lactamase class C